MNAKPRTVLCGAAIMLLIAGCSSGGAASRVSTPVQTPAAASPTTAASSAPAAPQTVELAQSDSGEYYGGTYYTGCQHYLNSGDVKPPQVFDTETGRFIAAPMPQLPAGEQLNRSSCALTGTAPDSKIAYVYDTTKPASGLNPRVDKKTAYLFDLHSAAPLATADVGDLGWSKIVGTSTGAVMTGNEPSSSGFRTEVLSNKDLSVLWTDPDAVQESDDSVLAFKRIDPRAFVGVELRSPDGESLYKTALARDIVVKTVTDGTVHLAQLEIQKEVGVLVTSFFDVKNRTLLNINGSTEVAVPGFLTSWGATVSDGHLFLDGGKSGLLLWNLVTQQVEFQKSADELKNLDINRVTYYGGYLYLATNAGDPPFSVFKLPDTEKAVATQWTSRPMSRINGWTLLCRNEIRDHALGTCGAQVLTKDQNGAYPGPWF